MSSKTGRREFLISAGAAGVAGVVGVAATGSPCGQRRKSRVVVLRHEDLTSERALLTSDSVRGLLDQAAAALAETNKPADAWGRWLDPTDRVAIKVNCLGLPTNPAVSLALARAIQICGVQPANTIIWDRTDRELERTGYRLRKDRRSSRCFGTDSLGGWRGGYDDVISTSGEIGSLYSRIVTEQCDALVSAPVLKDHNLAGLSCALKNFYGSIHNPNKYHDNGCNPFVADVCAHPHVRARMRLNVCDATRPQYHGGPPSRPAWQWAYGGIIMSTDAVALDRVGLEILERKRAMEGLPTLTEEGRPASYLDSAAARGLGKATLAEIEVVSIGRPWREVD